MSPDTKQIHRTLKEAEVIDKLEGNYWGWGCGIMYQLEREGKNWDEIVKIIKQKYEFLNLDTI